MDPEESKSNPLNENCKVNGSSKEFLLKGTITLPGHYLDSIQGIDRDITFQTGMLDPQIY